MPTSKQNRKKKQQQQQNNSNSTSNQGNNNNENTETTLPLSQEQLLQIANEINQHVQKVCCFGSTNKGGNEEAARKFEMLRKEVSIALNPYSNFKKTFEANEITEETLKKCQEDGFLTDYAKYKFPNYPNGDFAKNKTAALVNCNCSLTSLATLRLSKMFLIPINF